MATLAMIQMGTMVVPVGAKRRISKILDSGQISPGPTCREFEKAFARFEKAKEAVFVSSGTAALRIALEALKERYGWKDGDLVAVPAMTFVASVNTILQAGLKPYFVDVSMYDFNMNPENLEHRLETGAKSNLVAVMPVHLFGKPCHSKVYEVARKYKLKVIEDSCETVGGLGLRGDVACYSTYVCHLISTGVGGLALTNDPDLYWLMRSLANHGRHLDYIPGVKKCSDITRRFEFSRIGYSSRLTELEAALGLEELKQLPASLKRRRQIAERLTLGLSGIQDLVLPYVLSNEPHVFMMYPLCLQEDSKFDKWDLCRHLEKKGIETRDLMPILGQPCYKFLKIPEKQFHVANWSKRCGFYIGCHPGITDVQVDYVIKTVRHYLTK